MHFSRFFLFFERTGEEFYLSLGLSFTNLRNKGLWLPRVEAFCQYKKPARFGDMLDVELTVEQLREKSARLGFTVTNKETAELLATGYFVVVAADKNTGKATQIPKEFADKPKPSAKQIL